MNVGPNRQSANQSLPNRLPVIPENEVIVSKSGERSVRKTEVDFTYIPKNVFEYTNSQAAIVNFLDRDFNSIDTNMGEHLKKIPVWINEHKETESTQKSAKEKYMNVIKAGFSFNTPKHGMPYVGIIHFCAHSDGKCLKIEDSIKSAVEIMQQKNARTLVIPLSKELLQEKYRDTLIAVENAVSQLEYKPEEIIFINEVEGFCESFDLWGMEENVDISDSVKKPETETVTADSLKSENSVALDVAAQNPMTDSNQIPLESGEAVAEKTKNEELPVKKEQLPLDESIKLEGVALKESEVQTEEALKPTLKETEPVNPSSKKVKKKNKKKNKKKKRNTEEDGVKGLPSGEAKAESSRSSSREILQAQFQILSEDIKNGDIEKMDSSFSAIIYFLEKNDLEVSSKDLNCLVDSYQQLKSSNKKTEGRDELEINSCSFLDLAKSILMKKFEHCLDHISGSNSMDVIDAFVKMTADADKCFDFTKCNLGQLTPFMLQHSSLYSGRWIENITRHDKISIKAKYELMKSLYENLKKDFDSGECFKNSKEKMEKEFELFFKGFNYQNVRIEVKLSSLKKAIDIDVKILKEQKAIPIGGQKQPLPESSIKNIERRLVCSRSDYQLFSSYNESNSTMLRDAFRKKKEVINKYDEKLNEWIEKKTLSLNAKEEPSATERKEESIPRLESIIEKVNKQAVLKEPRQSEEKSPEAMYYEAFKLFSECHYKQSQEIYKKICEQHRDSTFYIHSKLGLMESHTRTAEFRANEKQIEDVYTKAKNASLDYHSALTQGKTIYTSASDVQALYNTVTEYSDKLLSEYTDIMQEQLNTVDELIVMQLGSSSESRPSQLSDEVLQFTIDTTLSEHEKISKLTEKSQLALIFVRQALEYRKDWLKNLRSESASVTTGKKTGKHTMSKSPDELMTDLDDRIKKLDLLKAKQYSTNQAISALKESTIQSH